MGLGEELDDVLVHHGDRLNALEREVDKLRFPEYKAETVDLEKLVGAMKELRPYTVIKTGEYERLLMVEKAAAVILEWLDRHDKGYYKNGPLTVQLREALKK